MRLFPPYAKTRESLPSQIEHIEQELREVKLARNDLALTIELFDVIHACETALDLMDAYFERKGYPGMVDDAFFAVVDKNGIRGYYEANGYSEAIIERWKAVRNGD